MPIVAHGDDLAFQRVQSGKQRGRTVALIVVGHGAAAALLHGQAGLGAVQSLNLALLVGAQHHGMLRRIQIQAHDVLQFLGELGIAAKLEGSHLMRLQPMRAPDATHAGLADAGRPRHGARRPVGGVGRFLMQRHRHDFLPLPFGDGARPTRPWSVLLQSRDAACPKAVTPTRRLFRRDAHPLRDLFVFETLGGQQHDARSFYHPGGQQARPRHPLQGLSLFRIQLNRGCRSHPACRPPQDRRASHIIVTIYDALH